MNNSRIANIVRAAAALMLIALVFTNLFNFIAEGGNIPNTINRSPYTIQYASYGICVLLIILDARCAVRLLKKPIFVWVFAVVTLFTWGMFVRVFDAPAGMDDYLFVREYGLAINSLAFLLSCVMIFDQADLLALSKRAIVLATLAGVLLNIYDLIKPGTFSNSPGRAAGLYVNANTSGMALVCGCVMGLGALQRSWSREIFLLVTLIGVLATVSRTAMLASILLMVTASVAGAWSVPRLSLMICGAIVLFVAFNFARNLREQQIIQPDADVMRTFRLYEDDSAKARAKVAQDALELFEEAPLLGHGFGTTAYWTDVVQSHNYYLSLLADYGIFGIFLMPCLILSIRRASWDYYAFAGIFLLWSFLDHLVLVYPFSLVCLAIAADEATTDLPRFRARALPVACGALLKVPDHG